MTGGGGPAGTGDDPDLIVVAVERGTSPREHAYDVQQARLVGTHQTAPRVGFPDSVRAWSDPPRAPRCAVCSTAVLLAQGQAQDIDAARTCRQRRR